MKTGYFYYLALVFTLISCNNTGPVKVADKPGKGQMAEMNRYLVQKDRERIQNYIDRKNFDMTESSTGLWYMISSGGQGKLFSENDTILMKYECFLLDGTFCYSSEQDGLREVILGKSGIEAGLNEGLRMLRPGARAVFILPPFLAYGFVGDRKKIPPRSILVYNVSILQTQ